MTQTSAHEAGREGYVINPCWWHGAVHPLPECALAITCLRVQLGARVRSGLAAMSPAACSSHIELCMPPACVGRPM